MFRDVVEDAHAPFSRLPEPPYMAHIRNIEQSVLITAAMRKGFTYITSVTPKRKVIQGGLSKIEEVVVV